MKQRIAAQEAASDLAGRCAHLADASLRWHLASFLNQKFATLGSFCRGIVSTEDRSAIEARMRQASPAAVKELIMSDDSQALKMRFRIESSDGSVPVATIRYG